MSSLARKLRRELNRQRTRNGKRHLGLEGIRIDHQPECSVYDGLTCNCDPVAKDQYGRLFEGELKNSLLELDRVLIARAIALKVCDKADDGDDQ